VRLSKDCRELPAVRGVLLIWEVYNRILVMDGRENGFQQIPGPKLQAGGVDAGVAAEKFVAFQYIPVDEQPYPILMVVHQAQNADRAGGNVQKLFHIFRTGEGEAGASNLPGENCGFKFLPAWHHQQVEGGFLRIAEKKILADVNIQQEVHLMAGFDGGKGVMVYPLIGNVEGVQQVIDPDFLGKTSFFL